MKLETEYKLTGSKILQYLDILKEKWLRLVLKYLRFNLLEDILFKADYSHISRSSTDYEVFMITNDGEDKEESC